LLSTKNKYYTLYNVEAIQNYVIKELGTRTLLVCFEIILNERHLILKNKVHL
jgi:hypothetical protein